MTDLLVPGGMEELFKELYTTDVTKTTHRGPYPSLSPSKPELSQAGRTVLVTGGGTSVGFAIARAFAQAGAKSVIILGRRAAILESAKTSLLDAAKAAGSSTDIRTYPCDLTDAVQVDGFWKALAADGVVVDVYVANAALIPKAGPILDIGAEEVWSVMETNAKSPLFMTERFHKQLGDQRGFIVNVSTQAVHMMGNAGVVVRPTYSFTKLTSTLAFQFIAQNTPAEKLQITNFHPGLIYSAEWEKLGFGREIFDQDELCGAFAVWLATPQAAFLHGRYAVASWDVDELSSPDSPIRKRLENDPYFLRGSIVGLNGMLLA